MVSTMVVAKDYRSADSMESMTVVDLADKMVDHLAAYLVMTMAAYLE